MNKPPHICPMCWSSSAWHRSELEPEFPIRRGTVEGITFESHTDNKNDKPSDTVTYCCRRCGYSNTYDDR